VNVIGQNYRLQDIQLAGFGRTCRSLSLFETKIVWDDPTSAPAGATVGRPT
jgi:hypothetical protein